MTQLKEPLPSQIMTGYMLEKAERKGTQYLWEAAECLQDVIQDMKAAGDDVNQYDVTDEREAIMLIIADLQAARKVHGSLAAKAKANGYRLPTDADFAELGAGGKR